MSEADFRFVVAAGGGRLDRLVADALDCGRRSARRWIDDGLVLVNGRIAGPREMPSPGSEVVVTRSRPPGDPGTDLDVFVLLRQPARLFLTKPAGLHCERGKSPGSVADLVEGRFGDLSQVGDRAAEAGLVHRIDRDTSGIVLVATQRAEYLRLRAAFGRGDATKQYLALVAGRLTGTREIDVPLARRTGRMVPAGSHDTGLTAHTRLESLEAGRDWSLLLATMTTGAMHQVRVHAAWIGHPLLGDALYGGPLLAGCRRQGQLLHAMRLSVAGGIDVSVGAPEDFLEALAGLRRSGG